MTVPEYQGSSINGMRLCSICAILVVPLHKFSSDLCLCEICCSDSTRITLLRCCPKPYDISFLSTVKYKSGNLEERLFVLNEGP